MTLLEQIRANIQAHLDRRRAAESEMDLIVAGAEARGDGTLTEDESSRLATARAAAASIDSELDQLQARMSELEAEESRRAAADSLRRISTADGGGDVRARDREFVYTARRAQADGISFFADAYAAQRGLASRDTQERLQRHGAQMAELRDVGTGALAGLMVPQYLVDDYMPLLRAGRPTANAVRTVPLPAEGESFIIPRMLTGTAVAEQATQNTQVQETDPTFGNLTANMYTVAGQVDVSRQSLERASLVDTIIFGDLAADYALKLNTGVLTRAATGLLNNIAAGNVVAYTDATPTVPELWAKLHDAITRVGQNRLLPAEVIIMHPRRWAWFNAALDTTGRPLLPPSAPMNPIGVGRAAVEAGQIVGSLAGLPVILDATIPTNLGAGTNEDIIIVARISDAVLMERPNDPVQLRFEETNAGALSVKLVVYGYVVFIAGRYTTAFATVGGTGLTPPTF